MLNLSAITAEAHRVARIYRGSVPHAQALSWGYAQAWQQARTVAAIAEREAAMSPDARARRDEALTIQCGTDGPLSPASISRLTELSRAAEAANETSRTVREHRPALLHHTRNLEVRP